MNKREREEIFQAEGIARTKICFQKEHNALEVNGGQNARDGSEMRLEDSAGHAKDSDHTKQQRAIALFKAKWGMKRYFNQFCIVKKSLWLKYRE